MITTLQMFWNPATGEVKDHSVFQERAAAELLRRREALRVEWMAATGKRHQVDPDTGSEISGKKGGTGAGGFRERDEGEAVHSAHKILYYQDKDGAWLEDPQAIRCGAAVDDFDPDNALDDWLSTFDQEDGMRNEVLERHQLYREHPDDTPGWCHLTTRAPRSGRRTFKP